MYRKFRSYFKGCFEKNNLNKITCVPHSCCNTTSGRRWKHFHARLAAWCCDRTVCMTGFDILVVAVGSAGGVEECVTTGPFGPHGCTSSSLVWAPRHGPSHHSASSPGLHCVTNRSRQPPTRRAENDNLGDGRCPLKRPVKAEHFPLLAHFRQGRDCLRPESGRVCGREHVMYMSIKSNREPVPLSPDSEVARLLLPSAGLLADDESRRQRHHLPRDTLAYFIFLCLIRKFHLKSYSRATLKC